MLSSLVKFRAFIWFRCVCFEFVVQIQGSNFVTRKAAIRNRLKNKVKIENLGFYDNNLTVVISEHPKSIEALFEDLHWLTLIASFTLTFDNPSESPQIPDEVITFTNEFLQGHPNTVRVTTRYLTSIGKQGNIGEGKKNHFICL